MNYITRVMFVSVITNIFLAIIKIIFGIIGKSGALIADGIHSFSDLVTDFFAIIGGILARKPADKEHPCGHGNLEYLTSMLIGILILSLGFTIISKTMHKEIIIPSIMVVIISFITIIAKWLLASFVSNKGKLYRNPILIASGKESKTDIYSSIVVLLSGILMQFSNKLTFLKYADTVASVIVGIFIIKVGFNVLKENISSILGESAEDEVIVNIKKIILENDSIIDIGNFILIKHGSYYRLTLEVTMDGNLTLNEAHNIIDNIENKIKENNSKISYITIHMEPNKN